MRQTEILFPVLALVGLTLLVLFVLGVFRVGALGTGRLPSTYYKLFREGDNEEPDVVRAIARNYHNLLELPLLFYAGCLLAYAAHLVSPPLIVLAWGFVALRVVHTLIHVTYNRVRDRATVFIAGFFVLAGFWTVLAQALLTGN